MFRSIYARLKRDRDYAERQYTLDVYTRVLEGALYEHLPNGFHEERNGSGEYVPIRDRRPSVRYNLCRLVVEDSVSLLFSEGHFPTPEVASDDADARQKGKEALLALIKASHLNERMLEAATMGSVGSVAIQMQIFEQAERGQHEVFFTPRPTGFLTPTFDPKKPDRLIKITERYKVQGRALRESGYAIEDKDLATDFWFQREWDDKAETWLMPVRVSDARKKDAKAPEIDKERTVEHTLGFCPWYWVRNLPGRLRLLQTSSIDQAMRWSDVDGQCTFTAAIDDMIEIEYQLSQAGRGLKYSMDPLLLLKEPVAQSDSEIIKQPSSALVVGEKGDGKLLELGGSAFQVVIEYVRALREMALENTHGNRADAQKLSGAQSGRAMELMNQALIWLADRLRISYGEGALLSLLRMAAAAHAKYPLSVDGKPLELDPKAVISLNWPDWYPPTSGDRQAKAGTLKTLRDGGLMSRETAVAQIAPDYDVEDTAAEINRIKADEKEEAELVSTKRQITQNA